MSQATRRGPARIPDHAPPTASPTRPNEPPQPADLSQPVDLSQLVDQWLCEGVITSEQAARIRQPGRVVRVSRPVDRRARGMGPAIAVEALGYLGGVVIVAASVLIASLYWSDLTEAVRLVLVGLAALLLLAAGVAVPERAGGTGRRLRSGLHLGGTVAVAGFLALLGSSVLGLAEQHVLVVAAGGAAVGAGTLWALHRVLLQQVTMMVAVMVASAAVVADALGGDLWPGLAAWVVAVVWLGLGWRRVLHPERAVLVIASVAAVVAAMTTVTSDAGMVLALLTTAGIVVVGVLLGDVAVVVVGAVGLLQALPVVVGTWFPDTVLAPFVLLVVGVGLLVSALWTALRKRRHVSARSH